MASRRIVKNIVMGKQKRSKCGPIIGKLLVIPTAYAPAMGLSGVGASGKPGRALARKGRGMPFCAQLNLLPFGVVEMEFRGV